MRNLIDVAHDEAYLWMFCKTTQVRLDRMRHQPIISVEEDNIVAPTRTETCVARSRKSQVLLLHTLHRRIPRNYLKNIIRRTVVNDNDFSLTVRLLQGALESSRQKICLLVTGNDHRYKRCLFLAPS